MPPPRYTSQSARSACGRDAEHRELRRKNSETSLATSNSVRQLLASSNSTRQLTSSSSCCSIRRPQRSAREDRLFNNASISPVLNNEGSRSSRCESRVTVACEPVQTTTTHSHSVGRLPISMLLLQFEAGPESGERASSRGAASSRSVGVSARQERATSPSSASVVSTAATTTARDAYTPRVQLRSRCPNLDIATEDAAAVCHWQTQFESALSSTFLDSRCPYRWLDESTQGPDPSGLLALETPFDFTDFRKEWDHPDESQFGAWYKDQVLRQQHKGKLCEESANELLVSFSSRRHRETSPKPGEAHWQKLAPRKAPPTVFAVATPARAGAADLFPRRGSLQPSRDTRDAS